jgi:acetyltransferase-like isoleucine patch superfamily enzyme
MPNTSLWNWLRLKFWNNRFKKTAFDFVGRGANFNGVNLIDIEDSIIIGENTIFDIGDSDPIYLGKNIGIARNCFFRSANHVFDDNRNRNYKDQGHSSKKIPFNGKTYSIVIEEGVWIGANCIILTGAKIGKGSVISAGSVVSFEIPEYSVAAGNPARVIKVIQ